MLSDCGNGLTPNPSRTLVSMRRCAILLCAILSASHSASAQQPNLQPGPKPASLTPASMPPDKLLAFAIVRTGLSEDTARPWHVKANFEILTGPNTGKFTSGTFEETWYGPKNYRRTYTYKGHTTTDYATLNGLYRSGDQAWPDGAEVRVRNLLLHPISSEPLDPGVTLLLQDALLGKVSLPCLYELQPLPANLTKDGLSKTDEQYYITHSAHLCFEASVPAVRIAVGLDHTPSQINFDRILNLDGRLVPQDIDAFVTGNPVIRVRTLDVSDLPPSTAPMTPPADATLLRGPVTVPWDSLERLPSRTNKPVLPLGAKMMGIEDTVNIDVVISPDGTVTSAKVLNGEYTLRDSALESVRKSTFKPFLLAGTPVEVHTIAPIKLGFGSQGEH